jgi:hypothetical protein
MDLTWESHIKYLFTQYDTVNMKPLGIDLGSYADVVRTAQQILLSVQPDPNDPTKSLLGSELMPIHEAPWTSAKIEAFRAWCEAGCPPGDVKPPPVPGPLCPEFIALSEVLTGFDGLGTDPVLAQTYIDRLSREISGGEPKLAAVLARWREIAPTGGDLQALVDDAELGYMVRSIIFVWYAAATLDPVTQRPHFGRPWENQYTRGLEWIAVSAHPPGYASELESGYWQHRPKAGRHTGLFPSDERPRR